MRSTWETHDRSSPLGISAWLRVFGLSGEVDIRCTQTSGSLGSKRFEERLSQMAAGLEWLRVNVRNFKTSKSEIDLQGNGRNAVSVTKNAAISTP